MSYYTHVCNSFRPSHANMNGVQTHFSCSKENSLTFCKSSKDSSLAFYKSPTRTLRNKASMCLRRQAIPQVALGFLATAIGIVTILIASVKPAFPFYVGADIWTGATCITAGGIGYKIYSDYRNGKVTRKSHSMMIAYGCLTFLCTVLSVLSVALSSYVLFMCTDDDNPKALCIARKRASLGLAVAGIVLECFLFATSVRCFSKFIVYRLAFYVKPPPKPPKIKINARYYPHQHRHRHQHLHQHQHQHQQCQNQKQDVYISRPSSKHAFSYGHHLCMHCKPHGCRSNVLMPTNMPPPYTQIAPYY